MYLHRSSRGPVDLAFTDRLGGVSGVPYDELNLALVGGDDPAAVAANHQTLMADFADGDLLADLHQVHGADVVVADGTGLPEPPRADGIVTTEPGITLMVRAADCVPVLFAADDGSVIAAAHSGRPGLVAGVALATVDRMRELGARDVTAWIGPYVCGACYEVPADLQATVASVAPASVATTSWGTPSLDIGAGVIAQLASVGVAVQDESRCTRETPTLYSYRRDGEGAGRHAGLIRIAR